jgi:hypothetical protein
MIFSSSKLRRRRQRVDILAQLSAIENLRRQFSHPCIFALGEIGTNVRYETRINPSHAQPQLHNH